MSRPPLLPVEEALARLLALVEPVESEAAPLSDAAGRILRRPIMAGHAQPPFDAAQMDGYAVALSPEQSEEAPSGSPFELIGEARAGAGAEAELRPGQAVRIFTGAPLPKAAPGARLAVALQEDAAVKDSAVSFSEAIRAGAWIRPAGLDFKPGDALLTAPRRLSPEDVALAAASGAATLSVARRPTATLLTLGDELRQPGEPLGPDQIYASNQYGVAALLRAAGAEAATPPIVPDDLDSLKSAIGAALSSDLIVTLGGASEGDHDLARPAFAAHGMQPDFYKIAMRPGKPLMAGRLGRSLVVGLPGNPVSAMICARVFLLPALAALEGDPDGAAARWETLPLAHALEKGGPRAHYMRAMVEEHAGRRHVRVYEDQDSSRLRLLSGADCLALRPANDPPREEGALIACQMLRK